MLSPNLSIEPIAAPAGITDAVWRTASSCHAHTGTFSAQITNRGQVDDAAHTAQQQGGQDGRPYEFPKNVLFFQQLLVPVHAAAGGEAVCATAATSR